MMRNRLSPAVLCLLLAVCCTPAQAQLPEEPVEIGHGPQFVFDYYLIDNHWAIRFGKETVRRVMHQPVKHDANPLIADEGGYVDVRRDPETGKFLMWYNAVDIKKSKEGTTRYRLAYAESDDGVHWTLPDLNLYEREGDKPQNIVLEFPTGRGRISGISLIDVPEKDRRGYRYIMQFRTGGSRDKSEDGIHVIGSHDGIHWDLDNDVRVAHLHSDFVNCIVYDEKQDHYVMYCRAKDRYRAFKGDMIDTGASRRIARMTSDELWTDWMADGQQPRTILIPDELDNAGDFNFFYLMPTTYHAGLHWGYVVKFRLNTIEIPQLTWSRDGEHFSRLPTRPNLLELGEDGAWDDQMIFPQCGWVEVGDEWWIYYQGWDGPHGSHDRDVGIGLATIRKEGFVSLLGPPRGGVVCTRRLIWPGGDLVVNADASEGEMTVRVSDPMREPIEGFNHADADTFTGDNVEHVWRWGDRSLHELKGREIRLEFYLQDAHLYTFRAAEP